MGDMEVSLASLASQVPGLTSVDDVQIAIRDVTYDSRMAGRGVLFVAIDGTTVDGHQFVDEAVAAGSPAVMVNRRLDVSVPQIVVDDSRRAMAHIARMVHGSPDADLTMVGITGTNGKTTVSAMCEAVFTSVGRPSGVIGTLGARIGSEPYAVKRTTPESPDLQRLLGVMRDRGLKMVFMEVSSHALELYRAEAIVFDIAVFTNLSQDHLDFHGDMESYFAAKRTLFAAGRAMQAVVNIGDPSGARLAREVMVPVTTVAVTQEGQSIYADVQAEILSHTEAGSEFMVRAGGVATSVSMPLAGAFNVENAAVAFAVCLRLGLSRDSIAAGLASLSPIAGRMQVVGPASDITVVVDYAHTPAAVEVVVAAARRTAQGRVVAVIGAAGDRDSDKRAGMGAAAARNADVTIVTTDNPRTEDPLQIATEVKAGADAVGRSEVTLIVDRSEAIDTAISLAMSGDTVLILGRGHEQGQEVMGSVIPFDDAHVAGGSILRRLEATS
jgi:UDP-N-acetylmuramoyl-L-alanyl-D-glutamate--2,6-diaminopimelate ligase